MFRGKPILKGFTVPNGYVLNVTSGDNPRVVQTGEYTGGPYTYQQVASGEIEGWELQPVQGAGQQQQPGTIAGQVQQQQASAQPAQQPETGAQFIDNLDNDSKGKLYQHVTQDLGMSYVTFYNGAATGRHSAEEIQAMVNQVGHRDIKTVHEPLQRNQINEDSAPADVNEVEEQLSNDPQLNRAVMNYLMRNKMCRNEDEFYGEIMEGNISNGKLRDILSNATNFDPEDFVERMDDDVAEYVADYLNVGDSKEDILYAIGKHDVPDSILESAHDEAISALKGKEKGQKAQASSGAEKKFSGITPASFAGRFDGKLVIMDDRTGDEISDASVIASLMGSENYESYIDSIFPKDMGIDLDNAQHYTTIREDEDGKMFVKNTITFSHESGKYMGEYSCDFSGDKAHFDCLELDKEYNSKGIGARIYLNLEKHLKSSGVEEITLVANITIGGYAWAKFGYDFDDYVGASTVRVRVKSQIDNDYSQGEIDQKTYDMLNSQLSQAKHAWDFAEIGIPGSTDEKHKYGKRGMLYSSWDGKKNLNQVNEKAEAYARTKK